MLYGSMASTVTLRFFRYFSSILYGCRAPVVSNSMMTTTGPFELSGFAAGVSVEGPIASVSLRLRSAGAAGFAEADGAASGCVLVACCAACGCGVDVCVDAGGGVSAVGASVVVAAGSEDDAGNVFISTGLEERASCRALVGREPGGVCWVDVPVDGRPEGVAMAGSGNWAVRTAAWDERLLTKGAPASDQN